MTNSIINPVERPQVTQQLSENIILTTVDDLYNWVKMSSLYPLMFGTACCYVEFIAAYASRFDLERLGMIPRATPRQADLLITAGTITMKYAPNLVRLFEQMPEPKYVIAMGACTITGGMFSVDSPSTVRGVDKLIPVDVYIPGCPPRPEAVLDGIIKLRKKIANESLQERRQYQQIHRYYSITHQMRAVSPIHDGEYLRSSTREIQPLEANASAEFRLPLALAKIRQE
ncbi:NADH-quinone oxidoreductase subunit NuoB [Fortiea contorta]|uniref:NADH-quinone oxidoreductase subunit NuoB n=1 Tax=Fortiea contorta TaxID=1892405 RepID=UPI0004766F85|nr:NADH-quinone oxidoreductase subunit NuoB [Fortiea contorta]